MEERGVQEKTLLTDLPADIIEVVACKLQLHDHFSFSISLCSRNLQDIRNVVRNCFKQRAMSLSLLWRYIEFEEIIDFTNLENGDYTPKNYFDSSVVKHEVNKVLGKFRSVISESDMQELLDEFEKDVVGRIHHMGFPPPPTVLARSVDDICFGYLDDSVCNAIAAELPNLRYLAICQNGPRLYFDTLHTLPHSLGSCTQLTILTISIRTLTEFPRCVLQLSNLRSLQLVCTNVAALPDDIGKRLGNLQSILIPRNPIEALPQSLLQRIEDYLHKQNADYCNDEIYRAFKPINIDGTYITDEYLRSVLTEKMFPNLRHIYFPGE